MPRAKKVDTSEWAVIKIVGTDRQGYYYQTNVRSPRGVGAVTVVLTKRGHHFCLSCRTNDTCAHSKFVSAYIDQHGLPELEK